MPYCVTSRDYKRQLFLKIKRLDVISLERNYVTLPCRIKHDYTSVFVHKSLLFHFNFSDIKRAVGNPNRDFQQLVRNEPQSNDYF
jgi:hypothetical protein